MYLTDHKLQSTLLLKWLAKCKSPSNIQWSRATIKLIVLKRKHGCLPCPLLFLRRRTTIYSCCKQGMLII